MNKLTNYIFSKYHSLVIVLIIIAGLFILPPYHRYALCCDDITVLQNVVSRSVTWRPLKADILNPYGSSYVYMFFVAKLFGYKAANFFLIVTILHILAAITAYLVSFEVTKRRIYSTIIGFLALLGLGGVEASDGAVNGNVYAAIIFWGMSIYFVWKHYTSHGNKLFSYPLLVSYLALCTAFCISPIRMHGSIIMYLIAELIAWSYNRATFKQAFLRTIGVVSISLLILKGLGVFGGSGQFTSNKTTTQLSSMTITLISHYSVYPFSTLANLLVPHSYDSETVVLNNSIKITKIPAFVSILLFILTTGINYFFYRLGSQKKVSLYSLILLSLIISGAYWSALPGTIPPEKFSIIVGIVETFIFLNVALLANHKNNVSLFLQIIVPLVWVFAFSIISHLYFPTEIFAPSVRYLVIAALGAYALMAITLSKLLPSIVKKILTKINHKEILTGSITLILIIVYINLHLRQVKARFYQFLPYRDDAIVMKIFNDMNKEIKPNYKKGIKIIYISAKDLSLFYFAVKYGGYERFSLYNKDYSYDHMPYFVTNKDDLIKIASNDKQILGTYGIPGKVTTDQIYAFTINERGASSQTVLIREEMNKTKGQHE